MNIGNAVLELSMNWGQVKTSFADLSGYTARQAAGINDNLLFQPSFSGLGTGLKILADIIPLSKQAQGAVGAIFAIKDIPKLAAPFRAAVTEIGGEITRLSTIWNNLEKNILNTAINPALSAGFFNTPTAVAGAMAGPGAAPAADPFTAVFDVDKGVQTFLEFEKPQLMFEALAESSGAAVKEINAVLAEAKGLGGSTSKTATEVAVLAGELLKLGFNAEQVEGAMSGVVKTSEATSEPLAAVGSIIASTINQFQLQAEDATNIGDLFGSMASSTATSIIDLGEAMKYVGGTAALANQSLADTTIAIGLLSNAGVGGSMAGTSLNQAILSLQKASASAISDVDSLGQSVKLTAEEIELLSTLEASPEGADFSSAAPEADLKGKALSALGLSKEDLLDSQGNLKSVLDIIPALKSGVEELQQTAEGTAQVPILLNSLFGETGGKAVNALLTSTTEDIQQLRGVAEEAAGFTDKVSSKLLSGLSGTLTQLSSAVESISLTVGEVFAPIVKLAADGVLDLINVFVGLPDVVKKALIVFTAIVPALVAYYRGVAVLKDIKFLAILATKLYTAAQTEESRTKLVDAATTVALEIKTKALAISKAAYAAVLGVVSGKTTLATASTITYSGVLAGLSKVSKVVFSDQIYFIKHIGGLIAGFGSLTLAVGQVALAITSLGAAQKADAASTAFSTLMASKQSIVLKGLGFVKLAVAAVTGNLSVANMGLAATYSVLIARLAIVAGAAYALKAVWDALTAGMAEASKLKKAADNIDAITKSNQIVNKEVSKTEGVFGRFFNSLSDGEGPVMAIQKAFGLATNASVLFRREMEATEMVAKSTNAQFDEGIAILNKYGVAQLEQGDKARLGAEGIKAFVAEASDQVRKINETISELQKQTPVNEEAKQALQVQIDLLTRQSSILQSRIQLIQSDTDLSKENAEAQAAVVISLEALNKKYQQLEKAQGLSDKTDSLKIEEALADGSLTAAKAAEAREQAESNAIQSRIDLNNKALEELKSAAEFVPADDRAKLEEEIANRTVAAVDLRIEAAKKEVEERENLNEKLIESERKKLSDLEAQASLDKTNQVKDVKTQQASGGLSSGEAQAQLAQINTQSVEDAIALEQKRLEVERGLAQKGLITRQEFAEKRQEVEQKTADLSIELLDAQIEASEKANDEILKGVENRLAAQEAALGLSTNAQVAQIRQSQLEGAVTQEDAELKLQEIRQQSVEQEKAIAQDKLSTIRGLVAQGVITQEEAAKQVADAEKELSDLNIQTLEDELSARETAKEKRLQDVADLVARESASAGLASQLEVNAIKQAQADKLITVEQAEKQLSDIKAQGLAEEVDRQSQQLAQIAQLRDEGILTEQEYGDKRIELERSIADVSSQMIESQIQEQQRLSQERVALLEAELKRSETLQDIANNKRTASLKQALNNGAISEAEFSQQAAQLKVQETQQAISAEQRKLAQVSQLLAEGLITAKEAAERRLEIEKGISEKEISLIDAKEAARKAAADAAIKSMEEAAARQAALAENTGLRDELKIKQSGGSEDDIAAQLAESSKRATEASIAAAQKQMAEISRLQARGLLSAKEAADRRIALEKEVLEGQISLVDQRIEAEKKATEAILKESEKQIEARKAALEMEKLRSELSILQGGGTDDEIATKMDVLNEKSAKDSIALAKAQMAEVSRLQSQGVISAEEAARQRLELEKEVISGQIGLLQQRRSAEQKLTDDILKESERRTQAQQDALERTTTAGITAIRARELAGSLSAEKAAKEISQIEMESQRQQLANLQSQLAEVAALRSRGVLTAEQAADKERELNKQVADANLSLIEAQIDAKKRAADEAVAAIDKTLTAAKRAMELEDSSSDFESGRLGMGSDTLSATADLMAAINNLEQQRLAFQIQMAEAAGNTLLVEQLKAEQFVAQFVQLQQSQQVQQAQLEIAQRQKEIEMEREAIQANIALLEAQAEVAKASAAGATAEELAFLQQMVDLRQQALDFTAEMAAGQQQLNQMEEEKLRVQQQAEKEALAQQRVQELQNKLLDEETDNRAKIADQLRDALALQQTLQAGFTPPSMPDIPSMSQASKPSSGSSSPNPFLESGTGNSNIPSLSKPQNIPQIVPQPGVAGGNLPSIQGDLIGAKEIIINVTPETKDAGVDVQKIVLESLNGVLDKTKAMLK